MLNSVVLVGRLTRDPELRKTNTNGTSVVSFRLASDDSFSKPGAEKSTLYIDVTLFGNRADTVAKYMRQGSLVGVTGRLSQRKYVSPKTNMEVTVTEIIASSVEFVGPKPAAAPEDTGYRPDVAPAEAETVPSDVAPESSNLSGLDVVEDDLPF